MVNTISIFTDGGSRGNPGPAAGAFVVCDENNNPLFSTAKFIPHATNNIAEYTGLLSALEKAVSLEAKNVKIYSDSELMVRQINGEYKVKNENLRQLYSQCVCLLENFSKWEIKHIPREKNTKADKLVNRAIDGRSDIEEKSPSEIDSQSNHLRLGFLISGGGRTLINIHELIKKKKLNAEISIVISSRSETAGVEKVKNAGLPLEIVRKKDFPEIGEFSKKIGDLLIKARVNLVLQAGWLCLWNIPKELENKVMNIHPALLPAFGGQGMWGHHVHEAVIKAGCKVSGCTVHFCTNEYDKGPIIVQRTCPVQDNDTPDTLAARVFEQECLAYPEAIRLFSSGRLFVQGNRVLTK
ncbi:MAG: Phosphoribosylglycinamide formyltransferase [Planctomycetes bacterium ADurb.Bin401]|nr:MAG: Phosphoribosylglycinamide formyltransferase [Planctomycetes bacterium ADurb.Bin401]